MYKLPIVFLSSGILFSPNVLANNHIEKSISFAGYTGLINTPNAEVLDRGMIDFSYNSQLDYFGESYEQGHNFIFSAGVWDNLEVNGMIASNTMHDHMFIIPASERPQLRDLSFNVKYQIPFIPKDWFNLAIGSRDVGGAANTYGTHYLAASKQWGSFRFSTGVASSDRITSQMDGVFAGVEWQALSWLSLQSEFDADAVNAAVRVTVPKEWLYDLGTLSFTGRVYSSTDYSEDDVYWGVNFSKPLSGLSRSHHTVEPAPEPTQNMSRSKRPERGAEVASFKKGTSETTTVASSLVENNASQSSKVELNQLVRKLRHALIADGFESVRVGFNSYPHIIVSFENPVFNQNDIDAFGLVAGRIAELSAAHNAKFTIQLREKGIPTMAISGDAQTYIAFLNGQGSPKLNVKLGRMHSVGGVAWVGLEDSNTHAFRPRVTLSPALSSTYASELGVYDYSLALKADIDVPLWKGAGVHISAQSVVHETDDYKSGGVFKNFSKQDGLERAVAYQTFELPYGFYNLTQIGKFKEFHDYTGITNETAWISPEGRHKLTHYYGYFEYDDYSTDRDIQTFDYQYNWVEQDISFNVTVGEFWRRDKGVKVETKFWYGDSYLSIYALDTDVQVAGISFSIPLSKRKSMNVSKFGQVKGDHAWRHGVSTRIGESSNALVYQKGYVPKSNINLDRLYFNQGRLSVDYVFENIDRMREAYNTYK
ncbi:hypothetical protein N473_05790 [Pseudoalteromonas luteoviolacea CPMOR-1]|uniref:Exopolysaccharide biosynthesis protein YbjH n=1 Tax=Pseudoalteromonas luteoviolacea CPMOR-1 TaxID=1365248 RepID=A0A167HL19_9GAMM|nr:YjbH domain-containing protein [Pseudoalteromonas luteoviolacea]KZN58253.1 hypothetical protein N473_05790 [Pseudoalteromonas luteoviolacea CPMOR-1]